MSEDSDRPATSPGSTSPGQPEPNLEAQPSNQDTTEDPTEALKRQLQETRLPADLKAQILADLPSPEEQERLYRELMEKGGLSFEEFFASLLAEFQEKP